MSTAQLRISRRKPFILPAVLTATLLVTWSPGTVAGETATSAAAIQYDRDWIVSTKAARELIDKGALVLDARGVDLKKKQGPLANAVPIVWQDLSQPKSPTQGLLIEDTVELTKRLQSFGISKDRPIVVVADPVEGWSEDGRIAWTLRTFGHGKVVIADGGLPALQKEGELHIIPAKVPGDFQPSFTSRWSIKKEELKNEIAKGQLALLDVREPREYNGETPYGESRGGHIPGAKGLWYKNLLTKDGKLLPRAEIEKILASNGVTKNSDVVAYCTGGIRSGWVTTLLNDLGYRARNYAGSAWDWSGAPASEYPLEKN